MAIKTKQELIDRLRELEGKKGVGKAQLQDISHILSDLVETTFELLDNQGQGGESYTSGAFLESASQPGATVGLESTATTPSSNLVLTGVASGNGIFGRNAQGQNEFSIEHLNQAAGANGVVVHELRHQSTGDISFYTGGHEGTEMFRIGRNGSVVTNSLVVSKNNVTGGGIVLSDDGDIVDLNDGYCSMRFSQGVRIYNARSGGLPSITLGGDGKVEAMRVDAKDALTVINDGNTDKNYHAELYTLEGSANRAISLRFHQSQRWWNKITVDNSGFHFVDGTDFSYEYRDIHARTMKGGNFVTQPGDGRGLYFWGGAESYKIYMSTSGAAGAGNLAGSADFNMYFRMGGGGTRGFVFQHENGGNVSNSAQIDSAGNFTARANITAFSDARLKTNVQAYEGGLEKVMGLKPVTYDRIDTNAKSEVGFIAQEVKEVEPSLVLGEEENGNLSLDYSRMAVLLTKALQEQQAQIKEQHAQIQKLNQKLEELEAQ